MLYFRQGETMTKASQELRMHSDSFFHHLFRVLPFYATILGIEDYNEEIGNLSQESIYSFGKECKSILKNLQSIQMEELDWQEKNDYRLLKANIEKNILEIENMVPWQKNPSYYSDLSLYSIFMLASCESLSVEHKIQGIRARLEKIPQVFQWARENLENPPKIFSEIAIDSVRGGMQFFNYAIPVIAEKSPKEKEKILEANQKTIEAFKSYLSWLEKDLLPRSNGEFAAGRENFQALLDKDYMLGLSVEELREIGQHVFDSTKEKVKKLAQEIEPGCNWRELIEKIQTDHPERGKLLETYRNELKNIVNFIREKDLITIPENQELKVRATPNFARPTIPYAAYMPPGAFEKRQVGQFFVSPVDKKASEQEAMAILQGHCNATYPVIAVHEAYPGHHLQLVVSNQKSTYIRKHICNNLFAEGWALYCEQMMFEQGYYSPKIRLFQLKDQLWRAARILIDTGLHCFGMKVEDAIEMLRREANLSPMTAKGEVRRYCSHPTQPSSYITGKYQILQLRKKFKDLPLKKFHDLLLSSGTVPFQIVEEEMKYKIENLK